MANKIVFIGAAGSGKSTLAADVFAELKKRGAAAELMPEFARLDIQANGPMASIWEQMRFLSRQRAMEDAAPASSGLVLCDGGTLTPYFYASAYCRPENPRERLVLQELFASLTDDLFLGRYARIFFLPLVAAEGKGDGTRYHSPEEFRLLDEHMRMVLTRLYRMPATHELAGPLEGRLAQAMEILEQECGAGKGAA